MRNAKGVFLYRPYCWEKISILIDFSISEQQFIEDCEVCCNPMEIFLKVEANEVVSFHTEIP
ncbi:CPXCG motif-containing cysteine-rich protein [Candidatus Amoebophilus asiaticus]|nr:CPXCG motif-containing cysteine-rich protein [Candidatus Amoebophilus asiaticus]